MAVGNDPTNPSSTSDWFSVEAPSPNGDFIIFQYKVRFPGMTKVRLFEGDSEVPLWRGQYVNREEGTYKVRFRRDPLEPGKKYRFEFNYKDLVHNHYFTN